MAEDSSASPEEIRKAVEKALVLQSYLLRRTWGVLYATLSLAMFVTICLLPERWI